MPKSTVKDYIRKVSTSVERTFNSGVDFATGANTEGQTELSNNRNANRNNDASSNITKSVESNQSTRNGNTYSAAYGVRAVPAAITVDPSFSTNTGELSPRYPYSEDNTGENNKKGILPFSLFNKYALYNFRGFYGGYDGSQADNYTDKDNASAKISRGPELRGYDITDVTEKKIIKYYLENYPRIAYSPTDFLYNKYFQEIPVNNLITLRRFAMPCEDNIFVVMDSDREGSGGNHLSTCTATTYIGEKTNNKLEEILKFSAGLAWEDKQATIQSIQAGSSTSGPGFFDKGTIMKGLGAKMAGISAADLYRRDKFGGQSDPMHRYSDFVLGPVNVIKDTKTRGVGIQFSNSFTLDFEYELKSWYMVNPKIAMLDILSNMLVMTTNNGSFWGGGWRYTGGQSRSYITDLYGDTSKLRQGDFVGYAQSVVSDVIHGKKLGGGKEIKGITGLFGDGSGGFSFKSVFSGIMSVLNNILSRKIGDVMDQFAGGLQNPGSDIPKALLEAVPTGYWHVTIGNPLNPIAIMGNMICKDNDFVLGGGLGWDDFPMEFKVSVKLEHGKPRDRSDIENMFNAGHGRIYAAPANDILNIAGKEIKEYGVYPTGPGMHTGIDDKMIDTMKLSKEYISNVIAMDILG